MIVKVTRFSFRDGELRAHGEDLVHWVWSAHVSVEESAKMQEAIRLAGMKITAAKWRKCTLFRDEVARDFR